MTTYKYNLVVPLAGKGQRMVDGGYLLPKPMSIINGKSILEWGMDSIDYTECKLTFVVRQDHVQNFSIDEWLKNKFGQDSNIVVISGDTGGAVDSVKCGIKGVPAHQKLIVFCPDVYFTPKFIPNDDIFKHAGFLLTFKANSPNYSYVKQHGNCVTETAEKIVISNDASVGVYCFKDIHTFEAYAEGANQNNKENYICPIYNEIVKCSQNMVITQPVESIYIMGTPEEFKFTENVSFKYHHQRHFVLCSDHSGFKTKELFKKILLEQNIGHIDVGCFSAKDCDYYIYVDAAVSNIVKHGYCGIGFCRSGQGINICANKHAGIRAALITSDYYAMLAIQHNAANFFSIPASIYEGADRCALHTILELRNARFQGGRHQNRLMKNAN